MTRGVSQSLFLVVLASAIGFGLNAGREEPLPMSGDLEPPLPPEPGAEIEGISAEAAYEKWATGAIFLDARSEDDFRQAHVAGAIAYPADEIERRYFDAVSEIDPVIPLLVYGAGPDSFAVRRVVAQLRDFGHEDVEGAVTGFSSLVAAGIDQVVGP